MVVFFAGRLQVALEINQGHSGLMAMKCFWLVMAKGVLTFGKKKLGGPPLFCGMLFSFWAPGLVYFKRTQGGCWIK